MAIKALGGIMRTLKRETALPVNISYIFHNPGIGSVAPATIHTHGLLMHVGVTTEAVRLSLGENKGWMTSFAGD